MRCDRNRHGGGVACYVKQSICFNRKSIFSEDVENIFFDILLPKTKPFTVGIFYRPPDKNQFLEQITDGFAKLNVATEDIFILGDMNINVMYKGMNLLKNKNITNKNNDIPLLFTHYKEFLSNFGLKQLITSPTRITCSTSTLIDHILTNSSNKITQYGTVDTAISDHKMIYCTRKLIRNKLGVHKEIEFRSLKGYTAELYEKALKDITFPNYENFSDANTAYSDLIGKITDVVNKLAPMKKSRIKSNSQDWFDGEVAEKITNREKLFEKFKKSRLQVDKDILKEARNDVSNLIKKKKKEFYEERLKENIGKPKELWKTLKDLGLPSKNTTSTSKICLQENNNISFDPLKIADIFKEYFSNLAGTLVSKLPSAPNKFGKNYVEKFYNNGQSKNKFLFTRVSAETVLKLLKKIEVSKSAGLDNLSGRFLKDGAEVLSYPISQLCNLSIATASFPDSCKTAKLKPLFKNKGSKTEPKNYRPISLLPLLSKVMEKVIHDQTELFLSENEVLYKFQSGFRRDHSTDTCLSFLKDN